MRTRAIASLRRPVAAPGAVTACRRGARSTVSVVYDALSSSAASTSSTSIGASVGVSVTNLLVANYGRRLLRDLRDLERRWLLRGMRVVRPGVDLELGQLGAAERALGQHALHSLLDDPLGAAVEELGVRHTTQAARV